MDVLTVISAFWLSTWVMLMLRTFSIINRLVDTYEIALVQKYKFIHLIIFYSILPHFIIFYHILFDFIRCYHRLLY